MSHRQKVDIAISTKSGIAEHMLHIIWETKPENEARGMFLGRHSASSFYPCILSLYFSLHGHASFLPFDFNLVVLFFSVIVFFEMGFLSVIRNETKTKPEFMKTTLTRPQPFPPFPPFLPFPSFLFLSLPFPSFPFLSLPFPSFLAFLSCLALLPCSPAFLSCLPFLSPFPLFLSFWFSSFSVSFSLPFSLLFPFLFPFPAFPVSIPSSFFLFFSL